MNNFNNLPSASDAKSVLSFFRTLQVEYMCCNIRALLYTKEKDKKFFKKLMSFKETKIKDIALKNGLVSIFASQEKWNEVFKIIVPTELSFPQFLYNNQWGEFKEKDMKNYYSIDREFTDGEKVGVLSKVFLKEKKGIWIVDGKEESVDLNTIVVMQDLNVKVC